MLKTLMAITALFLSVAAQAEIDLPSGEELSLLEDPQVIKMCGVSTRLVVLRGTIQPNPSNLAEKVIMLSTDPRRESGEEIVVTLPYLPKMVTRLKKNPVVKVIFIQQAGQLTTCLIEGKPFDEWMN